MTSKQNKLSMLMASAFLVMFALQACSMPTASPSIEESNLETKKETAESIATEGTSANVVEDSSQTIEEIELDPTEMTDSISSVEETTSETSANPTKDTSVILENGLSQAEVDSLIFMREEEKLARDVYLALYDIWGLSIFQNIANSEQSHMNAVGNLLATFNLPDPADTSSAGEFTNTELQGLYNELIEMGEQSLADALKVGAAIEEIDILDLEDSLEITEDSSIQRVYENLLKGSKNHLRAFTSTLETQTGEVYTPQYMSEDAYSTVITGSNNGGRRGNGRP